MNSVITTEFSKNMDNTAMIRSVRAPALKGGRTTNIVLVVALVAVLLVIGVMSVMSNRTTPSQPSTSNNPPLNAGVDQSEKTEDEKIHDTGTTPVPAVQAGFPGNTLPPAGTNIDFPKPAGEFATFNWKGLPDGTPTMYFGAVMRGNFMKLKPLAYFVVTQTPPNNPEDLFGDISIFVEGGKIGLRLLPGSRIFEYQFDFRHHRDYRIEMVVKFVTEFTTRVELWIDGASTGQAFEIKDVNMRDRIAKLSPYVLVGKQVQSVYLQAGPHGNPGWGDIKEVNLNSI